MSQIIKCDCKEAENCEHFKKLIQYWEIFIQKYPNISFAKIKVNKQKRKYNFSCEEVTPISGGIYTNWDTTFGQFGVFSCQYLKTASKKDIVGDFACMHEIFLGYDLNYECEYEDGEADFCRMHCNDVCDDCEIRCPCHDCEKSEYKEDCDDCEYIKCECEDEEDDDIPDKKPLEIEFQDDATRWRTEEKVGRILKKLKKVSDFDSKVSIINSNSPVAEADGKKVTISTETVSRFSEGELAFILAHEISHNEKSHSGQHGLYRQGVVKVISDNVLKDKEMGLLKKAALTTIATGASVIGDRMVSRYFENEADAEAVKLIEKAGYSRSDAISVFRKIGNKEKSILNTHPASESRIKNVSREDDK